MDSRERKIMIVEDEGLIAADLRGRLERAGYTVPAIAESAGDALKAIRETSPDLVLMDIRIKGEMDGIQVADKVRREFDVPVVYLTAYEDTDTLARASQTHAYGYIKKPIASASLQGSIEMAISKHQQDRFLREQRDWFSSSFAAVPHAVIVTDGAGRICYTNPVAEQLTGWSVDEALGRLSADVLVLVQQNHGNTVEDLVPVAMLQGQTMPLPPNLCLKNRSGRSHFIEGSIAPRYRDGREDGTVIVFRDVTLDRFEAQQVKQDEKQGALVRMAEGIVRHLDLELSVVAEESARLLDSLPLDHAMRPSAETLERAALDAAAVSGRLQAFARTPQMRFRPVQVNDLLSRLENAWTRLMPTFTLVPDPERRPTEADPWQLTRVIVTMLLHARSAMRAGSAVTLSVANPDVEALKDWIRVRVAYTTEQEDTAALERSFEPSMATDTDGVALAYRRIREMGGLVSAAVEPGKKVNLDILLPQVHAAAAALPLPDLPQPAVLLVEPNPEVRRVLHNHFSRHGYNLLETSSCAEALLLAQLYEGCIPLAIAHPNPNDPARAELTAGLKAVKPEIRVRLLAGYWQDDDGTAFKYLNKWDLLEWANRAIMSARGAVAAD